MPGWLVYKKRISAWRIAALAINLADEPATFQVTAGDLGADPGRGAWHAQDVWTGRAVGRTVVTADRPWQLRALAPHTSSFVLFTARPNEQHRR